MPATFEASESERGGLTDVRFTLAVAGETVPGRLWLPPTPEGLIPLVLIQHPGMSSKDDAIVAEPARAWASGHGERASADPLRRSATRKRQAHSPHSSRPRSAPDSTRSRRATHWMRRGSADGIGSHLPALADVAVRIIAKAEDELIPSDATAALYAGLPGGHFVIGPDVSAAAEEWLLAHL